MSPTTSARRRPFAALLTAFFLIASFASQRAAAQFPGDPVSPQWNPNELLAWSSLTDPEAPYNRSFVPLAPRSINAALRGNANARAGEARVQSLVAFNNLFNASAQGARRDRLYPPTFWQYLETMTFWGGSNHDSRVILAPSAHIIEAAHRNGVPIYGKIFFAFSSDSQRLQFVRDFLVRSGNTFPVADKLIEAARYFGYDGYFLNQETDGTTAVDANNMLAFLKYFRAQAPELKITWYDAMTETGARVFQNALNSANDGFVKDTLDLTAHSMFLNFEWKRNTNVATSRLYAQTIGIDPYNIYAGIDTEGAGTGSDVDFNSLFPAGQAHQLSLGIYRPEQPFNANQNNLGNFYREETRYWAGQNFDPSNTTTTQNWKGIANWIPERTAVVSKPFVTNFNTGHGYRFSVNGNRLLDGKWTNLSLQDLLPTYRWIVQSSGSKLNPEFDFNDAYYGGASLRYSGNLDATNDVKLYQTSLPVAANTKLQLIYTRFAANVPSAAQIGIAFASAPTVFTYFNVGNTSNSSWNSVEFDLSAHAGKTIAAIGLRFANPSAIPNYEIKLGRLAVVDGTPTAPAPPTAVSLVRQDSIDTDTLSLRLNWTQAPGAVRFYNVYARHADSSREWLAATPNNFCYVPVARYRSGPRVMNLEVETVSPEFVSSATFASVTATLPPGPNLSDKLAGTIIGTNGSFFNNPNFTKTTVFDGDLNTYFDAPNGDGAFVGLDLGAGNARVISAIRFAPRPGEPGRMVDGIFQGSNSADFSNSVTLAIIPFEPFNGALTTVRIGVPTAFRYLRYLSPNGSYGNIAELEFYGLVPGIVWQGTATNQWDLTTQNWRDQQSLLSTAFVSNDAVTFDDFATNNTDVVLGIAVSPRSVTFSNSSNAYSLNGSGKISGSGGLVKRNIGPVAISGIQNDYTGITRIEGGTLSVDSIKNGGSPSAIGASAPGAASLQLAGGALNYTGPAATSNRGFTIAARDSIISTQNDLTLAGAVVSTGISTLIKTGPGNLSLTNTGINVFGTVSQGLRVNDGTLTLDGASTQTNEAAGEMWVGSARDIAGHLVLNNTTLNVASWLAVGRGNGSTGRLSTLTATGSAITCGNFSIGYDDNFPGNSALQAIVLTNSALTNPGLNLIAESSGSSANITFNGASSYTTAGEFQLTRNANASGTITFNGTSTFTKTGGSLFSVGTYGPGTFTVNDSATLTADGDFSVGTVGSGQGTLNINNSASITAFGNAFIGADGTGTLNITGGSFKGGSFFSIGRFPNSNGLVNCSGGTLENTAGFGAIVVGEQGTGILNVSGTGVVSIAGNGIFLSNSGTGVGTVNLNSGGTLATKSVTEGAGGVGHGAINFNGGTLRALAGGNGDLLFGVDSAVLLAGGGTIDTNGNTVAISQLLTGPGGLTKSGAGQLRLGAANSYTGTTNVTSGTLLVDGNSSAATGALTLAPGTKLGGVGTIGGTVELQNGANVAPGNSVGTLVTGSMTWNSGASYDWEITDATSPTGTDRLDISGTLQIAATVGAPFTIRILPLGSGGNPVNFDGSTAYSWKLVGTTGGITGFNPAAIVLDGTGFANPSAFGVSLANGGKDLLLTYIPTDYTSWARLAFTAAELADPLLSGALADFDGDGIINLEEYAYGGNPKLADRNILPVVEMSGGYLVTTFTRLLDRTDLNYTVRASSDLLGFGNVARSVLGAATVALNGGDVTSTPDPADANKETVKARDNTAMSTATHRFMRVEIEIK